MLAILLLELSTMPISLIGVCLPIFTERESEPRFCFLVDRCTADAREVVEAVDLVVAVLTVLVFVLRVLESEAGLTDIPDRSDCRMKVGEAAAAEGSGRDAGEKDVFLFGDVEYDGILCWGLRNEGVDVGNSSFTGVEGTSKS